MDTTTQKGFVWWSTLPDSNVLGGKRRASTAVRDEHGRFMPTDVERWTRCRQGSSRDSEASSREVRMNRIKALLAMGWIIDQLQYDRWQRFYYVGAKHETGESVEAASQALSVAIEEMYQKAVYTTPQWYLDQLQKEKQP